MKIDIPQILWHDQQNKLMAIDVYPNDRYLVTASFVTSEDSGIKFWEIQKHQQQGSKTKLENKNSFSDDFKIEPVYLYDLTGGH